jgi:hypothetical protein
VDPIERLRSWTYQRQLLGRAGGEALDTLRKVVGVYSTHPTAPLALLARSRRLSKTNLQALEQRREVVRMPAMRQSIFMLPTDSAARVLAATRPRPERFAARLQLGGLDDATYTRLTRRVLECVATPSTPAAIRRCVGSHEDSYFVARTLAREGLVLRVGGSLRTNQLTYVATEAWLGQPFDQVDPQQALAWLAVEYLRAFGTARVADFAWWAGVPGGSARAALAQVRTTHVGDGQLLLDEDRDAFENATPIDPEAIDVLPKWDSYTMGYAPDGRRRFVEDQYLSRAYTAAFSSPGRTAGDGNPLVLQGGQALASWSHRFASHRLMVSLSPFNEQRLPDGVFDAVGELLSASAVEVTTAQ